MSSRIYLVRMVMTPNQRSDFIASSLVISMQSSELQRNTGISITEKKLKNNFKLLNKNNLKILATVVISFD